MGTKNYNNHIYFNSKKGKQGTYVVYYNNSQITYSVYKYGEHAKLMAEYSLKTGIKLNNWFKDMDKYIILYSYLKNEDEYKEILIDKDDYDKVSKYYWQVYKHRLEYYARTEIGTGGKDKKTIHLHRFILNLDTNDTNVVDHIKGNGLDNRKCNLRSVSINTNNKNKVNLKKANENLGVIYRESYDAYIAGWTDNNGKRKTKTFACKKYGKEQAKKMAIEYRNKMTNVYYDIPIESSTTNTSNTDDNTEL